MSERKQYQVFFLLSPKEGMDDEFHEWYENTHLDEVLGTTDGYTSAQRFGIVPVLGDTDVNSHLAVYDCVAESPEAALADLNARRAERQYSDSVDRDTAMMWVVEALGDKHVRAD